MNQLLVEFALQRRRPPRCQEVPNSAHLSLHSGLNYRHVYVLEHITHRIIMQNGPIERISMLFPA